MQLSLANIVIDDTIDIRESMNEATIQEYMDILDRLPPVTVFDTEDGYVLADGFHRATAAERLGLKEIDAEIRTGTRTDALEFAAYANATAALKLTPEERRVGIRRLHRLHPDWNKTKLAQMMGCGERVVQSVITASQVRTEADSAHELRETQVEEIAKAPREYWEPLSRVAADKGWTNDEVSLASKNVRDPNIPQEHKTALLSGETEPITRRDDGTPAVLDQTVRRHMAQEAKNDFKSILAGVRHQIALLRRFEARRVVDGLEPESLATQVREMPADIRYLDEIVQLGRQKLEIWEVPSR